MLCGCLAVLHGFVSLPPRHWVPVEFVRHEPTLQLHFPGARWSGEGRMLHVPYDPTVTTPALVWTAVAELIDRWYPGTNRPVLVDPGAEVPTQDHGLVNGVGFFGALLAASGLVGTLATLMHGFLSRLSLVHEAHEAGAAAARKELAKVTVRPEVDEPVHWWQGLRNLETMVAEQVQILRDELAAIPPAAPTVSAESSGMETAEAVAHLTERIATFETTYGPPLKLWADESQVRVETRQRYEVLVEAAAAAIQEPRLKNGHPELTAAGRQRGRKHLADALGIPFDMLDPKFADRVESIAARIQQGITTGWILHGPTGVGKTKVLNALPFYFAQDDRGVQDLTPGSDWCPLTVTGALDPERFRAGCVSQAILESIAAGGLPWVRINDINRLRVPLGDLFGSYYETVFRRASGTRDQPQPRCMNVLRNGSPTTDFEIPPGLRILMTRNPIYSPLCETGNLSADLDGRITEVELLPLDSAAELRLLKDWLERNGEGYGEDWSLRALKVPSPQGWLEDLCRVAAACRRSCHPEYRKDEAWRYLEPGVVTLRTLIQGCAEAATPDSWDDRLATALGQRLMDPISQDVSARVERHHLAETVKETRFRNLAARLTTD
jgi:hypothetical protein